MSKHTPGPWFFKKDFVGSILKEKRKDDICYLNEFPLDDELFESCERGVANGCLIAAAPDMYEALMALSVAGTTPAVLSLVEKAIAKAEGSENG